MRESFLRGRAMATLGRCYAQCIVDSGVEFDLLLGPAYKGIPLGTATAIALADQHGINVPFAYNRKEVKAHGEGGSLVGAPLVGRALVIDDVITAGTAVREVLAMIEGAGATLAGVVIGLDRQERGAGAIIGGAGIAPGPQHSRYKYHRSGAHYRLPQQCRGRIYGIARCHAALPRAFRGDSGQLSARRLLLMRPGYRWHY